VITSKATTAIDLRLVGWGQTWRIKRAEARKTASGRRTPAQIFGVTFEACTDQYLPKRQPRGPLVRRIERNKPLERSAAYDKARTLGCPFRGDCVWPDLTCSDLWTETRHGWRAGRRWAVDAALTVRCVCPARKRLPPVGHASITLTRCKNARRRFWVPA